MVDIHPSEEHTNEGETIMALIINSNAKYGSHPDRVSQCFLHRGQEHGLSYSSQTGYHTNATGWVYGSAIAHMMPFIEKGHVMMFVL